MWLAQWHVQAESLGEPIEPRAAVIDALQRLAVAEGARRSGAAASDPAALAVLDLRRFADLLAIAVVDREYGLRWVQARSSASLSTTDLQSVEQACDVLIRRPVERVPTVVNRRELRAGGPGYVVAVPVLESGRVASFIVGLFRADDS